MVASHPHLVTVTLAGIVLLVLFGRQFRTLENVRGCHGFHPFPVQQLPALPNALVLEEDTHLGQVRRFAVHAAVAHVTSVQVHFPHHILDAQRIQQPRLQVLVKRKPGNPGDDLGKHVRTGDIVSERSARFMGIIHGQERTHLVVAGARILGAGVAGRHGEKVLYR